MRIVRPRHSVAVIFPLHDHRGFGLKALRAWQQQRDAGAGRHHPATLRQQVAPLLRGLRRQRADFGDTD